MITPATIRQRASGRREAAFGACIQFPEPTRARLSRFRARRGRALRITVL